MDANKVRLLVTNVPKITKRVQLANLPVSLNKKINPNKSYSSSRNKDHS